MSTILEILEETADRLRGVVDDAAKVLADGPTLDELEKARTYYAEQIAEAQRKLRETEDRIADRKRAEAAHADAQRALADAVELTRRHRRTVEAPSAAEAIAATGLPVQPKPPVPRDETGRAIPPPAPPDDDLPFNVVDAPPETVAAITGGTPIIADPDALTSGSPIVTATDPTPAPAGGQPRHAKPRSRGTGPLRLLHRHPADTSDDTTETE